MAEKKRAANMGDVAANNEKLVDEQNTTTHLLPQHKKLIEASAITSAVMKARGYRSVTTAAELKRLGFSDSQWRVPALLIPVFGVSGEIETYQARPDYPRIKNDKALKYETPAGSKIRLDVPPMA